MACPTCIPILCSVPNDYLLYNLNSGAIYRNQGYSFVLYCPVGYVCYGTYPRTIVIDPGILPPIVAPPPNPGEPPMPISIQGCSSAIFRQPPLNATAEQMFALVQEMFAEAAAQEADCINKSTPPTPGLPPPVPNGPGGPPVTVINSAQSFTAQCVLPLTGPDVTVTVPAGTYSVTAANPTPASIASLQASMNAQALAQATSQAQAALVCSSGLTGEWWTLEEPGMDNRVGVNGTILTPFSDNIALSNLTAVPAKVNDAARS